MFSSPQSRISFSFRLARKVLNILRRSWFILRHGGLSQFFLFIREEVILNSVLRLTRNRPIPEVEIRVTCCICGWRRRFMTHMGAGYVVTNAMCPMCVSFPRRRGFAWLLDNVLKDQLLPFEKRNGLRLLFSSEQSMFGLIDRHLSRIEGVDLRAISDLVTFREDIQQLSFGNRSVDFLSCFHAIEHVPDDLRALRELCRVLHPEGRGIINVPITFGRWETIKFDQANPLLNDHYFDYGEDFVERIAAADFRVIGYRLSKVIPESEYRLLALQGELIFWVSPAGNGPAVIVDLEGLILAGA